VVNALHMFDEREALVLHLERAQLTLEGHDFGRRKRNRLDCRGRSGSRRMLGWRLYRRLYCGTTYCAAYWRRLLSTSGQYEQCQQHDYR